MEKWKNRRWVVIAWYFLFSFSILFFLVVPSTFTFIFLLIIAILTISAHKSYKKANQKSKYKYATANTKTFINVNQKNKEQTDLEKRIQAEIIANPNITEEELKEKIVKEEKEKIVSEILKNIKIEINYGKSTPKENQSKIDYLSYSKIRKLTPDFIVLDFETTGLSPDDSKIIQIGAVRYRNFEKVEEFLTYVDPLIEIPKHITQINGITNDMVKGAPTIDIVIHDLINFLKDDVIVAHNAPFDMKFLLTNMMLNGVEYKKYKVIDTLSLARKYIDCTKNHKLETLKSFLRLNHLSSHDALHDCYVTAELYKYCYEKSLIKSNPTHV